MELFILIVSTAAALCSAVYLFFSLAFVKRFFKRREKYSLDRIQSITEGYLVFKLNNEVKIQEFSNIRLASERLTFSGTVKFLEEILYFALKYSNDIQYVYGDSFNELNDTRAQVIWSALTECNSVLQSKYTYSFTGQPYNYLVIYYAFNHVEPFSPIQQYFKYEYSTFNLRELLHELTKIIHNPNRLLGIEVSVRTKTSHVELLTEDQFNSIYGAVPFTEHVRDKRIM